MPPKTDSDQDNWPMVEFTDDEAKALDWAARKTSQSESRRRRRFVHLSRAWYAATALKPGQDDEVRLGVDWVEPENGCDYEFLLTWRTLGGQSVPRLDMFDDSWEAIRDMADVMEWLADHAEQGVTPEEVCDALLTMGFVDGTPTELT